MKKFIIFLTVISLLLCCGCSAKVYTNTDTFFMMDTVVTISADCSDSVMKEAFELCSYYEKMFSRTIEDSDIYRLNKQGSTTVSDETRLLIEKAVYYGNLSEGRYDITVAPVSSLYDFSKGVMPTKEQIEEKLGLIDYTKIEIDDNEISLNGTELDLGSIAKGYIADKLVMLLKDRNVKRATINLGGNLYVFGDKNMKIGVRKPFSDDIAVTLRTENTSIVTSGIYQRYIEKDGKIYHHIIDCKTGYGVENDLSSVTVIGDSSADCDALSTVCMLLSSEKAVELINSLPEYEAVFILRNGEIKVSDGLTLKNKNIIFK
ncbi:MAG: FAD:protein FMN transferase [Acutalibacteraceae bacterium]|nr:FAD:protein FMN transferase [Acutalibacteraceae bacterium]